MYALPNKTQHKLIVKVRGGISQKLDNFTSSSQSGSNNSNSNSGSISTSSSALKTLSKSKEISLTRHIDETGFDAELSHLPQPVFRSLNQNGSKQKSLPHYQRAQKQFITPEHNEMIKYVQQSWKGVERDYKKSVNNFINNLDFNSLDHHPSSSSRLEQKQVVTKKKTATTSTPLLLSGSYHHTSESFKDSSSGRQDSFQPFDLEAFWGNRILKRLTGDM